MGLAKGLRLARPLPGTQGLHIWLSLAWVMNRDRVIINQKKKKNNKIK
jgi:hypothetical protein